MEPVSCVCPPHCKQGNWRKWRRRFLCSTRCCPISHHNKACRSIFILSFYSFVQGVFDLIWVIFYSVLTAALKKTFIIALLQHCQNHEISSSFLSKTGRLHYPQCNSTANNLPRGLRCYASSG